MPLHVHLCILSQNIFSTFGADYTTAPILRQFSQLPALNLKVTGGGRGLFEQTGWSRGNVVDEWKTMDHLHVIDNGGCVNIHLFRLADSALPLPGNGGIAGVASLQVTLHVTEGGDGEPPQAHRADESTHSSTEPTLASFIPLLLVIHLPAGATDFYSLLTKVLPGISKLRLNFNFHVFPIFMVRLQMHLLQPLHSERGWKVRPQTVDQLQRLWSSTDWTRRRQRFEL